MLTFTSKKNEYLATSHMLLSWDFYHVTQHGTKPQGSLKPGAVKVCGNIKWKILYIKKYVPFALQHKNDSTFKYW